MSEIPETHLQRLEKAKKVRDEMGAALKARLEQVEKEEMEMMQQYQNEKDEINAELKALGLAPHVAPADMMSYQKREIAEKVYNLLKSMPGQWFTSHEINKQFGNTAALNIVMKDYVQSGRVEMSGKSYRVA